MLYNARILLFTDDIRIYLQSSSLEYGARLQEDLDGLSDYCLRNKTKKNNISKCWKLKLTRKMSTITLFVTLTKKRSRF